jgi:aerobic-type carbon monoxide dehydrogenase small subunit (CoxS/CutS family)
VPQRHNGYLGARIQGNELPDSFRRDLTSGLTNRLMIRVMLHRAAEQLHARAVQIAVRYDLWDEKFTVTTQIDGVRADTIEFTEIQQVIQRLQQISLPELFSMSSVPADSDVVMRAVVLLNPIDRERMDAIRERVTQNNNRASLDPAGALGVGDISVSNAIFNRIFEQYASGSASPQPGSGH